MPSLVLILVYMRLFIALDLPNHVRSTLAEAQSRLRQGNHAVRWARVEGTHLTLQFLGETDAKLVPDLLTAVSHIRTFPFSLRLDRLGAFPSASRPRIIWAGLAGDLDHLATLQRAVTAATRLLGFVPEDRPFAPHLTLGRARQDVSAAQIQALAEALRSTAPPTPAMWTTDRPQLFESVSTPKGVVYTVIDP